MLAQRESGQGPSLCRCFSALKETVPVYCAYREMSCVPSIVSIQVGRPQALPDFAWDARRQGALSSIFKVPVEGTVFLEAENLVGDQQADRLHHGGPDKALLLYAASHYPIWTRELNSEIPYGAFGENLTVDGCAEESVCIGDVWLVGGAVIQISQPRLPCWKLDRRFGRQGMRTAVDQTGRTGWYARVLEVGDLQVGDRMTLVERYFPDFTIEYVRRVFDEPEQHEDMRDNLVACVALASEWRNLLSSK